MFDKVINALYQSSQGFSKTTLKQRHNLLYSIATALDANRNNLIKITEKETHLEEARLNSEFNRTLLQWRSYADHCLSGLWLNASIDNPTQHGRDIRKTMVPLGPVVVFGASNFPFAYSTAGGDTASALAAGCSVIVKAHPAHPETSAACAAIISRAMEEMGLPTGIFTHIEDSSLQMGEALVKHPLIKAVAFTGSLQGGRQLFDWANQRDIPIPVFAEMGSLNPIFLLPEKLKTETETIALQLFESITQSMGQFCTKPGLIIGLASEHFSIFIEQLSKRIQSCEAKSMLHQGILDNYHKNRDSILHHQHVTLTASSTHEASADSGIPTLAKVKAADFLLHPEMQLEVFGPFSLIVECDNMDEMQCIAEKLQGQLTASVFGTEKELRMNERLLEKLTGFAGRLVCNGVPTGVDVCLSMHHGGPYPASTDSRFTAVGGDAIQRFARPICFQNFPDTLLPDELKNDNPLGILRKVNNQWGK
jgi:NADP-dependent aldehyde dehydrogenase